MPNPGTIPVFVGTYTDDRTEGIHILQLDTSTGDLSTMAKVADVRNPFFLATCPNNKTLYAGCCIDEFENEPGGSVRSYAIGANGALTQTSEQASKGATPCYLSVDSTNRCVLVANYSSGNIAAFSIHPGGKLGPASQVIQHEGSSVDEVRQEGPHVHSIVLSPDSRFAFAADLGLDKIMIYQLDFDAGKLRPHGTQPFAQTPAGAGPRHMTFSPNRLLAFVINEIDNTITSFNFDESAGTLETVETVSTLPDNFNGDSGTADIHFEPSGRFLYGSNRGHDSIAIYAVDGASGRLQTRGHVLTGGQNPRSFAIDPSGNFLLAANQSTNDIHTFRINQDDGSLAPTGHVVEIQAPVSMQFHPSPRPPDRS